jgi:hypothetical protein
LFAGAVLFLGVTAYGRSDLGTDFARTSRYTHAVVAMMLPALGVAIDALARRWRATTPVLALIVVVGVVGNVNAVRIVNTTDRAFLLALPRSRFASQVPASTQPDPINAPKLTIGWLLNAKEQGRLPTSHSTSADLATADLALAVHRVGGPVPSFKCTTFSRPLTLHLKPGRFAFAGLIHLRLAATTSEGLTFRSVVRRSAVEVLEDVTVVLTPEGPSHTAALCTHTQGR